MTFQVRESAEDDCEKIMDLIVELAVSMKMPDQVKISSEDLRRDGFGPGKLFHCNVAQDKESTEIIGYVLFFYIYSTWDGQCIYMQDLYVTPTWRKKGVGTQLLASVAKVALDKGCQRLDWEVLSWNKPSIEYYTRQGAIDLTVKEDWHLFRMTKEHFTKMASKFKFNI